MMQIFALCRMIVLLNTANTGAASSRFITKLWLENYPKITNSVRLTHCDDVIPYDDNVVLQSTSTLNLPSGVDVVVDMGRILCWP